jgi:hypothetical protein
MPRRLALPCAAALTLLLAGSAQAWGTRGHEWISGLAIERLPAEVPAFLRTAAVAEDVAILAREPDRWRQSGPEHDGERDAGHYVHLDDQGLVLGVLPLSTLPDSREAFDTALRARGADQYQAGYLPYAIVDGWQQLVKDFAYWRADQAGARSAADSADRAWFAADLARRERLTVRDLGIWSHYVGDASNPMHVSTHYMGWGEAPNPRGYSTDKGLHWRFEALFLRANLTRDQIGPGLKPYRDCACSIQARTAAYLTASQALVVPLYDLEAQGGFADKMTPASRDFALTRLAAGSNELRDMIVDAWRASAQATVSTPAIKVADIEAGKVVLTRKIFGDE